MERRSSVALFHLVRYLLIMLLLIPVCIPGIPLSHITMENKSDPHGHPALMLCGFFWCICLFFFMVASQFDVILSLYFFLDKWYCTFICNGSKSRKDPNRSKKIEHTIERLLCNRPKFHSNQLLMVR